MSDEIRVSRLHRRLCLLAFGLAVAALFSRALTCDFVDYDDDLYVTHNAQIQRGLTAETFAWSWTAIVGMQWYPLTLLSHLLDVSMFGLNPAGHHATSVMLHALNSVLLFLALRALTGNDGPSALVALLFAVHPLRVESVAWVSERKDVLSGAFWMLGLWAWAGYVRSRSVRRYLVTLAVFVLGLMSKPSVVTFPCVLLLLDYWPLGRFASAAGGGFQRGIHLVVEKAPFFALSLAAGIGTIASQSAGGAVAALGAVPLDVRVLNALGAYGAYVWQTFVPVRLTIAYPIPDGASLWTGAAGGAVLILMWLIAGVLLRKRAPYVLVGGLWFVGVLVPVIGLLQVGAQAHADRYTYLSQIGLLVAVAWPLWRWAEGTRRARHALILGVAIVSVFLGALTWRQIGVWRSSETLFAHALSVSPSSSRAEVGYARAMISAGRNREAIPHLQRAIALEPGLVHSHESLVGAYLALEDWDNAHAAAVAALRYFPDRAELLSDAGTAALHLGRAGEAAAFLERAVSARPVDEDAWVNLGIAQGQLGNRAASERSLRRALDLDASHAEALYNLGVLYGQHNEPERAREYFGRALQSDPAHELARRALDSMN